MGAPSVRQLSAGIACACALAAPVARTAAQTPATTVLTDGTLKVRVNDPRPLARVLDELEQLCQCVITYEDVRLSDKRDLVQVPMGQSGEAPTWMPRGGPFEFSYDGIVTLVHQRVPGVVSTLLHRYNGTNYPGRFALTITGTVFHVLPARPADKHAAMRPGESLLDTPIEFESTVRTMADALEAFKDALTEVTGENVLLPLPPSLVEPRRLVIGANSEPARDVLLRILAASRYRLSWRLLYDASMQTYTLKIHAVSNR